MNKLSLSLYKIDKEIRVEKTLLQRILLRSLIYLKIPKTYAKLWDASIEIAGTCNLNCKMCGFDGSRAKGIMPFDIFQQIIDQLSDLGCLTVAFHVYGEPFLHPKLDNFIDYARQKNMIITLYTNATLLNIKGRNLLKNHPVDVLRISFFPDKGMFENLWHGARYDEVIDNLRNFLKESQSWDHKILLRLNILHEHGANLKFLIKEMKNLFGDFPNLGIRSFEMVNLQGSSPDLQYAPALSKIIPCKLTYFQCVVLWNGDVVPCCHDLNGMYVMGNIKNESFASIRNNKRFTDFRKKMLKKSIDELLICQACPNCRSDNGQFINNLRNAVQIFKCTSIQYLKQKADKIANHFRMYYKQ